MPAPKKKEFKIIQNPELLAAGRAFVPVYGSDEDLSIVTRMIAFDQKLRTVDNEILRGSDPKKLTTKMKDILYEERSLIQSLTSRNNDF